MTTVNDLIRLRRKRRENSRRVLAGRLGRGGLILTTLLSLTLAVAAFALALLYSSLTRDLPSVEALPLLLSPPDGSLLQPTRFYDRTGEVLLYELANPEAGPRRYLPLANRAEGEAGLPEALVEATLAAADPDFWQHPGFSLSGFPADEVDTLALRLVRDLLTWREPPGLRRALRERLLAAQITHRFGREQVLEWYLNSADYGHLAFGAEAAARLYLGKSAADLTLAEAALLAAVSQAPALNPIDAPELARQRQAEVLARMSAQGRISQAQAQAAQHEPLHLRPTSPPKSGFVSAYINRVMDELAARFPRQRLERGGLKVITSLDVTLQREVACALVTQMGRLAGKRVEAAPLPPLPGQGESTTDTAADCETARLLPTFPIDEEAKGGDDSSYAEAVVLDPLSAQVLALAAVDQEGAYLPRLGKHPPGSLLTPYVYLTAFTRGYSPASLVWDIPASLPSSLQTVANADGEFHGPMRLRTALANDYIVPAVQLLSLMGAETVWKTAQQVGLSSLEAPAGESAQRLLLEGGALELVEAAHAFGVFSTQGVLIGHSATSPLPGRGSPLYPSTLSRVQTLRGETWFESPPPQSRPVVSAQLAYLLTHVLSDEAARWPSMGHPNPLEVGRPVGVKLGKTVDGGSTWTMGFTPQLVVGVWIGEDSPSASGGITPLAAAGVWHAIIKFATRDLPPQSWPTPAGISTLEVCDPSGQLPTPDCPTVVREVFAPGSEPTHPDNLFRRFQINRETGRLATVFTPASLIEERVYLVPPPEAAEWAQQSGLPTPPEEYDLVAAPVASPNAQLTSPEIFSYVRGEVPLMGTATGAAFDFYRLQIGQGLNPRQWVQITDEVRTPVEGGQLALWDTSGLSGLYAIRLQVIDQQRRVDIAVTQVTVDNQPPQVFIRYPAAEQQFTFPHPRPLVLQVEASDDLGLARVEITMDGERLAVLSQPPFVAPWTVTPGEHLLRVQAFDLAGNVGEAQITFSVSE